MSLSVGLFTLRSFSPYTVVVFGNHFSDRSLLVLAFGFELEINLFEFFRQLR